MTRQELEKLLTDLKPAEGARVPYNLHADLFPGDRMRVREERLIDLPTLLA